MEKLLRYTAKNAADLYFRQADLWGVYYDLRMRLVREFSLAPPVARASACELLGLKIGNANKAKNTLMATAEIESANGPHKDFKPNLDLSDDRVSAFVGALPQRLREWQSSKESAPLVSGGNARGGVGLSGKTAHLIESAVPPGPAVEREPLGGSYEALIAATADRNSTFRSDIDWVYRYRLTPVGQIPADSAPSPGAVALLQWVKSNPANITLFYTQLLPKALPKGELEETTRHFDDGRDLTGLLNDAYALAPGETEPVAA